MFLRIKTKIERELKGYIKSLDKAYSLSRVSPLLFKSIKEFLSRRGKRVRPILFTIGYLGFSDKAAPGLYRSAVSIELLHDFMLVHDDIIDKSDTRRGRPSMHTMFNRSLKGLKSIKFSGEDLTIVAGDIMFAMALHAFLYIKEEPVRKEKALNKLIEAALYTGSGEFIELFKGAAGINEVNKNEIYRIYDLKTANYTFASPLCIGATLAGARERETQKLFSYGIRLGRAFQIKDDIIGIFADERVIGKPNLTDIKEGKKTILIWQAYNRSSRSKKLLIKGIFKKNNPGLTDLKNIRKIIEDTGSLLWAKNEVKKLMRESQLILESSAMKQFYKKSLSEFARETLSI